MELPTGEAPSVTDGEPYRSIGVGEPGLLGKG